MNTHSLHQQDTEGVVPCPEEEDEEAYEAYMESLISITQKWITDGAATLDEAIEHVKGFLQFLEELKEDSYELVDTVDAGHGDVRRPNGDHTDRCQPYAWTICR